MEIEEWEKHRAIQEEQSKQWNAARAKQKQSQSSSSSDDEFTDEQIDEQINQLMDALEAIAKKHFGKDDEIVVEVDDAESRRSNNQHNQTEEETKSTNEDRTLKNKVAEEIGPKPKGKRKVCFSTLKIQEELERMRRSLLRDCVLDDVHPSTYSNKGFNKWFSDKGRAELDSTEEGRQTLKRWDEAAAKKGGASLARLFSSGTESSTGEQSSSFSESAGNYQVVKRKKMKTTTGTMKFTSAASPYAEVDIAEDELTAEQINQLLDKLEGIEENQLGEDDEIVVEVDDADISKYKYHRKDDDNDNEPPSMGEGKSNILASSFFSSVNTANVKTSSGASTSTSKQEATNTKTSKIDRDFETAFKAEGETIFNDEYERVLTQFKIERNTKHKLELRSEILASLLDDYVAQSSFSGENANRNQNPTEEKSQVADIKKFLDEKKGDIYNILVGKSGEMRKRHEDKVNERSVNTNTDINRGTKKRV